MKTAYKPKPEELPSGICECGCGKTTGLAKATYKKRRHFRGYPVPYSPGHSPRKRGPEKNSWKGGRYVNCRGYAYIYAPEHPKAAKGGHVLEHRYVVEQHLGRILERYEEVHHINGIKDDNRLENLQVLTTSEHTQLHNESKVWRGNTEALRAAGRKGADARWHKE